MQQQSSKSTNKFSSPRTSNHSIYSQTQSVNVKTISQKLFELSKNEQRLQALAHKENVSCRSIINQMDMEEFLKPFNKFQIKVEREIPTQTQYKQSEIQKDSQQQIKKQKSRLIYNQQHQNHQKHQQNEQNQQVKKQSQNYHQQLQEYKNKQLQQRLQQKNQQKYSRRNASLTIKKDKTRNMSQFGINLKTVVQQQNQCSTKRAEQQQPQIEKQSRPQELQEKTPCSIPNQIQTIQQQQVLEAQLQAASQQIKRSSLLLLQAKSLSQKSRVHFAPIPSQSSCPSSINLYEQILSKNFEIIDCLLRKINQIFSNQQESQSILSQVRTKLVKIQIDNQNLHHQFRTSHFVMEKKLNMVMVQYGNVLGELNILKNQIKQQRGYKTNHLIQDQNMWQPKQVISKDYRNEQIAKDYVNAAQQIQKEEPKTNLTGQQINLKPITILKENFFFGQSQQQKILGKIYQIQTNKTKQNNFSRLGKSKKSSHHTQETLTNPIQNNIVKSNPSKLLKKQSISNNIDQNDNQYIQLIKNIIKPQKSIGNVQFKDFEVQVTKMVEKIEAKIEGKIALVKSQLMKLHQKELNAVNLRINQIELSLQQSQSRLNLRIVQKSNQSQTIHRLSILSQQVNFRISNILQQCSLKFAIRSETKRAILFLQNKLNKIIQADQHKENKIINSGELVDNEDKCLSCSGKGGMIRTLQLGQPGKENVGSFFHVNNGMLNNSTLAKQSPAFKQDQSSCSKKKSQSRLKFHLIQQQPPTQHQQTIQKLPSFHKTCQIRSKNTSTYQQIKQQGFQSQIQQKLWKDKVATILLKKDISLRGTSRYKDRKT